MTGLKDAYKSGGDHYLGNTGQIRMEVNAVSNQVQNVPSCHLQHPNTPSVPVTLDCKCEDTLNHLGNCYKCNKPGHLKRNCRKEIVRKLKQDQVVIEDLGRTLSVTTVTNQDTLQVSAGDQRRVINATIHKWKRGS